jgi:hypothetical protein
MKRKYISVYAETKYHKDTRQLTEHCLTHSHPTFHFTNNTYSGMDAVKNNWNEMAIDEIRWHTVWQTLKLTKCHCMKSPVGSHADLCLTFHQCLSNIQCSRVLQRYSSFITFHVNNMLRTQETRCWLSTQKLSC